jgi:two-component system response regulator YesN
MESILIVDDEQIEREGIRDNIDWIKLGFDRVEIAADGQQALQMIEQSPPSILLTDICMPFMDGLELCKTVRSLDPTIKVIIVTGHDEFPYAQQAVHLGASELILKPVTAQELTLVLQNISQQIDQERAIRRDLDHLRAQMQESLPILRERFLIRFLQDHVARDNWDEQSTTLGIKLIGTQWLVIAIRVDHWEDVIKTLVYEKAELLLLAIETICQEYSQSFPDRFIIHGEDSVLNIILGDHSDQLEVDALAFGQIIRKMVADNLEITVTVGVGRLTKDIFSLANSYRDALTALGYRLLLGDDRIISIADMEPNNRGPVVIKTEYSHRLATSVRTGAVKEVDQAVEDLISFLSASKVPVSVGRMVVMHAITEILEAAYELNGSETQVAMDYQIFFEIQRSETLSEIKTWLHKVCVELATSVQMRRESDLHLMIEQAKVHILNHFTNPDLSLQDICQLLHVSSSYFSLIFKRETGNTFLGFLTEHRIHKAKELLLSTSLKGYQIAEQVGYVDPNYFSTTFRKHCGISPLQFRERRGV